MPGTITAADVGLVVAHNAQGPRGLQIREAGVNRQVVALPAGPGPRFELVYDSTAGGTPQVSHRVQNPAATPFELRLEASGGVSVQLGRLEAVGRSGLQNRFIPGDIPGEVSNATGSALKLARRAIGGVELPRERIASMTVQVQGRLGRRGLRGRGLEQLAAERLTSARGRTVAANLVPNRFTRFTVPSMTGFIQSAAPTPATVGKQPLAIYSSTRPMPAFLPNRQVVIPPR